MNRLTSSRDELLKLLGQGAGIVERRQTLPILANVLIQHNANGTLFITSDMEVQIRLQAGERYRPVRKTPPSPSICASCSTSCARPARAM